ncbi:MAG: hypothetical protein JJE39_08855 [Vicinamibacteria bacterium]|nr:hypothetical protein [Vicinamibacteria bacterium]
MTRARLGFVLAASFGAALSSAVPARAGGLGIAVEVGLRSLSNSADTEKAIFDSRSGVGLGLGLFYGRGERWRFGLDVRHIGRDGERAFAADRTSPAFHLGHPLNFTMNQGVVSAAYLFGKIGPVSPYLAIGGGLVSWKERSDIAGLIERAAGTSPLFEGRVGFERQQGWLRLGLEGGITFVPNAIGVGGISQVYEESDLGGVFVVAKMGFSRR